jgi:hypothetical protein
MQLIGFKIRFINHRVKENDAYIQSIQKCSMELEYAKFNKDSILAASEEVVPQVKLSASGRT